VISFGKKPEKSEKKFKISKDKCGNLKKLVKLDVNAVFKLIGLLFKEPEPLEFITKASTFSTEECPAITSNQLLKLLTVIAKDVKSIEPKLQYSFYMLLARIAGLPETDLEPELCISTAQKLIAYEYNESHGRLIKSMLKGRSIPKSKQLEVLTEMASKSPYKDLYVYLLELNQDYVKCFEIYMSDPKKPFRILDWLEHMKEVDNLLKKPLQELIYEHTDQLVNLFD